MIIQNAVFLPKLGIYLHSSHCHDYVSMKVTDDFTMTVDGGQDYFRRSIVPESLKGSDVVFFDLTESSTIEDVINKLLWGITTEKKGDKFVPTGKIVWKPLSSLNTDHLKAIVELKGYTVSNLHKFVAQQILIRREQDDSSL